MLGLLLHPIVFAQPADEAPWRVVAEEAGCIYFLGPSDTRGFSPLRAECTWPDVEPAAIHSVLGAFEDYDLYFTTVGHAETVGELDGRPQVRNIHKVPAFADREVVLEMWREEVEDGWRYLWTRADHQPEPGDGRVLVARDEGHWTVTENPAGGVRVVTQLHYDPGGAIPVFLVRWFQTSGMVDFVEELHTRARGEVPG